MLQKTTLGVAVAAALLAVVSFFWHPAPSPTLGYVGSGTTFNSVQLTPSSSYDGGSDLYALGWNTMANRWNSASATVLVDDNGGFVGPTTVNGTLRLGTTTLPTLASTTAMTFGSIVVSLGTSAYPNLAVGNPCEIGLSAAPAGAVLMSGFVSSVGSATSTASYVLMNGSSTAQTIASGTVVSAVCLH